MKRVLQIFTVFYISVLSAQLSVAQVITGVEGLSENNARIENKRVEKRTWNSERSNILEKRFELEQWDKHFSSLGRKRSAIDSKETIDREVYEAKRKEYATKDYEMSRWNKQFERLQENALIKTDQKASVLADRQLYYMMLQDTSQYEELGVELSLRDINKYQFRRNRSDGDIPVTAAGSAE